MDLMIQRTETRRKVLNSYIRNIQCMFFFALSPFLPFNANQLLESTTDESQHKVEKWWFGAWIVAFQAHNAVCTYLFRIIPNDFFIGHFKTFSSQRTLDENLSKVFVFQGESRLIISALVKYLCNYVNTQMVECT